MDRGLRKGISILATEFQTISYVCVLLLLFASFFITTVSAQNYQSQTAACTEVGKPTTGCNSSGTGANMNDCGGTYNLDVKNYPRDSSKFFPAYAPKNFGDPNCEFTASNFQKAKSNLYNYINSIDASHVYIWYTVIIPGESGYDPNAWAAPVGEQLKLNPSGAWGLIQMGSAARSNGVADRGDVYWQNQLQNGVTWNGIINTSSGMCSSTGNQCAQDTWCYWSTAKAYACVPL